MPWRLKSPASRWPVNFPHKWPVTRKMFSFDDVIIEKQRREWYDSLVWSTTRTYRSHEYGILVTDNPILHPRAFSFWQERIYQSFILLFKFHGSHVKVIYICILIYYRSHRHRRYGILRPCCSGQPQSAAWYSWARDTGCCCLMTHKECVWGCQCASPLRWSVEEQMSGRDYVII